MRISSPMVVGLAALLCGCPIISEDLANQKTEIPGDDTAARDFDGDGFTRSAGDCDDVDAAIHPGADEICDGVDNDCDGAVDDEDDDVTDQATWYIDADHDGFGSPENPVVSGDQPLRYVADDTDCDDALADVHPGVSEKCDGLDNNCDGEVDEDAAVDALSWYADTDGDGFGTAGDSLIACTPPLGYVGDDTDCYDFSADAYPGQTSWYVIHRGDGSYDFNCDGQETKRWITSNGSCGSWPNCFTGAGWLDGVPVCGVVADWVFGCDLEGMSCAPPSTRPQPQHCR